METIRRIADLKQQIQLRRKRAGDGFRVGFVPTMGYLHEGHLSLIRTARERCELVVLSIFVNPMQFGPNEDFDRYPRNAERDLQYARQEGVDLAFLPPVEEMYPDYPLLTKVAVSGLTDKLCGLSRPGHFDGVATVVAKLLNIVQPDQAFFGLKDAQQVAVIERMTRDLNMNVEIVPCPILREANGLAMSSRNVFLNPDEREQAVVLSETLNLAEQWIEEAGMTAGELRARIERNIRQKPLADLEYAEILAYPSLEQPGDRTSMEEWRRTRSVIAAVAVKFGTTRLIDNRIFKSREVASHV